jgi:hypothetical protein
MNLATTRQKLNFMESKMSNAKKWGAIALIAIVSVMIAKKIPYVKDML